jgi:hypothetical protein
LPVKDNCVSPSRDPSSVDELGLARPRIQYKVDDPDGYVRASFNKIVDLHEHVFRAMNVTQFKLLRDKRAIHLISVAPATSWARQDGR